MAQTNPDSPTPETSHQRSPESKNSQAKPGPKPKRRHRKWPWVILVLLLILAVIVIVTPSVLSTGWARSLVVKQIDARINGHVEIKDWSLGWTSPIRVDGVVVYDESNRQILQLPHFQTQLTLLNAVRGNYALGKTEIDGLDVLVSREPDGSLNWEHLAKKSSKPGESETSAKSKSPSKLPNVSGEVLASNCSITYEDRSAQSQTRGEPVFVRSLQADVKIPDINQPITNSLSAQMQIGSAAPGTISTSGTIAAVKNNAVAADSANVHQSLDIRGIDLAMLPQFMAAKVKPRITGHSDGNLVLDLSNGNSGGIQANLGIKGLSVASGEGAQQRQILTDYTSNFVTSAKFSKSAQSTNLQIAQLSYTDSQKLIALSQVSSQPFTISMPASAASPSQGRIHLSVNLKRLNDILQALNAPQVVAEDQSGAKLQSAQLEGDIAVAQASPQQISLNVDSAISSLTVAEAGNTPIQNETIRLVLSATANQDFSQVDVPSANLGGNLFSVTLASMRLKLSNGPGQPPVSMLQYVQQGQIKADVPALAKIQTLMRAFSTPKANAAPAPIARDAPGPAIAAATRTPPAGAIPATQPQELPPANITSGSLGITITIANDGQKLTMVPAVSVKSLAFTKGSQSVDAGNIDLHTQADIISAAPTTDSSASLMDQIQEIRIGDLHLTAPSIGGADVALLEPIDLKDPAGLMQMFSASTSQSRPSATSLMGGIQMHGDIGPLLTLMDAMSGEAPSHKLAGAYAISQRFSADGSGGITASTDGGLNDLQIDGQPYPEKSVKLVGNLALDARSKTLDLRSFALQTDTTNALKLNLKGRISDLGGQQKFDVPLTADVAYDLAPLWSLLQPLMTPEQRKSYAGLEISGKSQQQFIISGAYPSGKKFNEAVQSLLLHGTLHADHFSDKGLTLNNADLPVDLKGGVARLAYAGKPAGQDLAQPISCNGGWLNLGGASADLRGEHILLSTPDNLQFLKDVSLNPVLASWGLGEYLNNPMFAGASASGQLNMTILSCKDLPIDDLGNRSGQAKVNVSIGDLQLGSPQLAKVVPAKVLGSLKGQVPSYGVTISNGMLSQDFTLALLQHKRPIHLTGQVNLATRQLVNTNLNLPWTLFGVGDKNLQKYLPEGIDIPMTGTSNSAIPAVDINKIIQKYVAQAGQKYLQDQLLGGGKNNAASQPADQNPINQLEDLFNKKKKKNQ